MATETLEIFKRGTQANENDKYRKGNTIFLPAGARVIATGDLHGNRRNFQRIVKYADLDNTSIDTHLVLQEIIHGGPEDDDGGCLSFELLIEAVKLKIKYPDNVHILLGNHDTAFISHSEVMKNGKEMNLSLRNAIRRCFNEDADDVDLAIARLLFAQPLAVRTENSMMISHSLPADRYMDKFDSEILNRKLKVNDIVRPGSAYIFTWGRRQSTETIEKLSGIFNVQLFITGHQHQQTGHARHDDKMIIITSDNNFGVLIDIDTSKKYSMDTLIDGIIPLASIA